MTRAKQSIGFCDQVLRDWYLALQASEKQGRDESCEVVLMGWLEEDAFRRLL